MKISVVIVCLNEEEFILPCIKAIYDFADRIGIYTNYRRSWAGEPVLPDATVEKILRIPDRKGKISLHIFKVPDEAIARNWLMRSDGYRLDHRHKSTTSGPEEIRNFCESADYFWILDADEIYDTKTIPDILNYVAVRKPGILKLRGMNYFKSWNYRISPSDGFYQAGFVKRGRLFRENRNILLPRVLRLVKNKYWDLGLAGKIEAAAGVEYLSEKTGVFHHGAYVGSDRRIYKKVFCSVHRDEKTADWYENTWKRWTPASKNFHPSYPEIFKGVEYVPTAQLPVSITGEKWPAAYIDV